MKLGMIVTNLCYGSFNPLSTLFCHKPFEISKTIVEVSDHFDYFFIVNDKHKESDKELSIMPPHMMEGNQDVYRMFDIENQIKSRCKIYLNKNTFSAVDNTYNLANIKSANCDSVCVSGFIASIDVLYTLKSLIDLGIKTFVLQDCIGDLSEDSMQIAIEQIKKNNIPILSEEEFLNAKNSGNWF